MAAAIPATTAVPLIKKSGKPLPNRAQISLPAEGESYDALLIIRGCTGCPYLYEEIDANERILCVKQDDIPEVIEKIRNL